MVGMYAIGFFSVGFFSLDTTFTDTVVLQTNKKISIANLIQQVALHVLEMKMTAAGVNMILYWNAIEQDVTKYKIRRDVRYAFTI